MVAAHAGAILCAGTHWGTGPDVAVTGGTDGKCLVWDVQRRVCLRVFERHAGPVSALVVFPANPLAHSVTQSVGAAGTAGAGSGSGSGSRGKQGTGAASALQ